MKLKRLAVAAILSALFLSLLAWPAHAQDPLPVPESGSGVFSDLFDRIVAVVGSYSEVVSNVQSIASLDWDSTTESYFGVNWRSVTTTTAAYESQTAPAGYFDQQAEEFETPDEIRDLAYGLEELRTVDTSAMSPRDYASYLGALVAAPFLYIRGVRVILEMGGPMGLLVAWLLIMAVWVTMVRFFEFIWSNWSRILDLAGRIVRWLSLVKP